MAILIVLITTAVITLVLFWRKSARQKLYDDSYSTLSRENAQQRQPQSLQTPELYDQIQLSPSTGQAESESINNNSPPPSLDIHPIVNTEQLKYPNSDIPQTTAASNFSLHDAQERTSEQPTYAVVDKRKKQMRGKELVQSVLKKEGHPVPLYDLNAMDQNSFVQKGKANAKETATSHTVDSLEELYTAVKKKAKGNSAEDEEEVPPPPPHTVEELYTAVKKKAKGNSAEDEEEAPPLPPHTVKELY